MIYSCSVPYVPYQPYLGFFPVASQSGTIFATVLRQVRRSRKKIAVLLALALLVCGGYYQCATCG
jgi:hypothetical protein